MKRTATTLCALLALATAAQAQTIDIRYSGSTATVSVPATATGVTCAVSGANVTIQAGDDVAAEYTYRLAGTAADGSLTLTGKYKLTLQLDGLDLTNAHGGAAIDIECGKRIAVELLPGTVSRLADSTGSKAKQKAAFYFKGHAEFSGAGTLLVTGRHAHAIAAKEYMELKRSLGTIHILGAVKDGLHCGRDIPDPEKNYFQMAGGTVNILGTQGDCIDSGDYGTIRILGGSLGLNVPDGATGLKADSIVSIQGGTLAIDVPGQDAEAIRARYLADIQGGHLAVTLSGQGAKGIKAKRVEPADDPLSLAAQTVTQGGYLLLQGGEADIEARGGNLVAQPGDTTRCMALSVDADLTQTGGTVTLTALGTEARLYNVKGTENRTGGTLGLIRSPWLVAAADYQYDMSAYVQVTRDGTPLDSYDGLAVGAFIGSECVGYAVFSGTSDTGSFAADGAPIGLLRVRTNDTAPATLAFRLYDYATASGQELTADTPVTFAPATLAGTPDAPLLLALPADDPDAIAAPGQTAGTAAHPAVRHNLAGQRVGAGHKGIVIVAGRKVLQR